MTRFVKMYCSVLRQTKLSTGAKLVYSILLDQWDMHRRYGGGAPGSEWVTGISIRTIAGWMGEPPSSVARWLNELGDANLVLRKGGVGRSPNAYAVVLPGEITDDDAAVVSRQRVTSDGCSVPPAGYKDAVVSHVCPASGLQGRRSVPPAGDLTDKTDNRLLGQTDADPLGGSGPSTENRHSKAERWLQELRSAIVRLVLAGQLRDTATERAVDDLSRWCRAHDMVPSSITTQWQAFQRMSESKLRGPPGTLARFRAYLATTPLGMQPAKKHESRGPLVVEPPESSGRGGLAALEPVKPVKRRRSRKTAVRCDSTAKQGM